MYPKQHSQFGNLPGKFLDGEHVDITNASMQAYVDAKSSITDHGLLSNLSGDGHPQYLLVNGTRSMAGNLSMNSHPLTGLATPSASTDAATKGYVDAVMLTPLLVLILRLSTIRGC